MTASLSHPCLVTFIWACLAPGLALVAVLAPRGNFHHALRSRCANDRIGALPASRRIAGRRALLALAEKSLQLSLKRKMLFRYCGAWRRPIACRWGLCLKVSKVVDAAPREKCLRRVVASRSMAELCRRSLALYMSHRLRARSLFA